MNYALIFEVLFDFPFNDDDVFPDALTSGRSLKRKRVSSRSTDAEASKISTVDDAIHPSSSQSVQVIIVIFSKKIYVITGENNSGKGMNSVNIGNTFG